MNEEIKLLEAIGSVLAIIASSLGIFYYLPRLHIWKSIIGSLYALKTAWEGYRIPAITYSFHYEILPIVAVSLLINLVGWGITSRNPNILFLDMAGTAAASFLLGPWWGVIVGILTNVLNARLYPKGAEVVLVPWMLVNLTGGIFWGLMARTSRFRQYLRNPPRSIISQAKSHLWYLFWFGVIGAAVMAIAGAMVSAAVGNDPLTFARSSVLGSDVQRVFKKLGDLIWSGTTIGTSEIVPSILKALLRWLGITFLYIPDKTISAAIGLLTSKYVFPLFEQTLITKVRINHETGDNWLSPATGILLYVVVFPSVIFSLPQSWLWYLPLVLLLGGCVWESRRGTGSQAILDERIRRVRFYIAARCHLVHDEFFGAVVLAVLISSLVFMSGLFFVGSLTKGTIAFLFLKTLLAYFVGFCLLQLSMRQWAALMFSEKTILTTRRTALTDSGRSKSPGSLEGPPADNTVISPLSDRPVKADVEFSETKDPTSVVPSIDSMLTSDEEIQNETEDDQKTLKASSIGEPEGATPEVYKSVLIMVSALLIAIGIGAALYYLSFPKQKKSIAVLPFTFETDNRDIEYLADGIAEDIISTLTQVQSLSVKPRDSAFYYKGKEMGVRKIGEELNVDAVLKGHLRSYGNQITLHVDLVDVETETNLWSADYERQMLNLASLHNEIAKDLTQNMVLSLSGEDRRKLAENGTDNSEAYQLYLHGRSQWNKRTAEGLQLAVSFYNQAIDKDPGYARAYSGLAETYALYPLFGVAKPIDSMPRAKTAALRALEIDRGDSLAKAKAHAALGAYLANYAWNQPAAERELRLAIEISPNYETAYHWLGNMPLQAMKKFDESIAMGKKAEALDSLSAIISADTGQNLFFARRFPEAIIQFHRALTLDPNYAYTHYYLAATYHAKGMYLDAIAEYRKSLALDDAPYVRALLARSLVKAGQRSEAEKILADLKSESEKRYVQSVAFALIYGALGQKNEAFSWLEKDFAERSYYPAYYAVDPTYDDLRDDPRFGELIRRVASERMD